MNQSPSSANDTARMNDLAVLEEECLYHIKLLMAEQHRTLSDSTLLNLNCNVLQGFTRALKDATDDLIRIREVRHYGERRSKLLMDYKEARIKSVT
jgi:hypothetical protein